MSSGQYRNPKSYRTSAALFAVGGSVFAILAVVSGRIGVFLPFGAAFVIAAIGFWQRGKRLSNQ